MSAIPGGTELLCYEKPVCSPLLSITEKRPVILLATALITKDTIFSNGLFQNILILYKLFESIGYDVYLLVERRGDPVPGYNVLQPEDILKNPIPIKLFIEIGMSVATVFREYLRQIGAKIVKLYLGNSLNIDIETTNCTPGLDFPHHITGDIDEIWTSPHYGQNLEYLTVLNGIDLTRGHIAPYVWDRMFIDGRITKWSVPKDWRKTNIVICEPNISYQKLFLIPLLMAEAFATAEPTWKGKVIVMNTDRFKMNVHVSTSVLPQLKLQKEGRLELCSRKSIVELTRDYSDCVFIGNQWNNEFNYLTMELMIVGFPLMHNSAAWNSFGYYYGDAGATSAQLKDIMMKHQERLSSYRAQAEQLAWTHSIYNPDVEMKWKKLLESSSV
jgi:hypothetical protein